MEGRARAAQRELERDIALAWHVMAIDRDNQKGRMKPLDKYLKSLRPAKEQTGDEVAALFLSLKAKGKSVKITERKRA